MNFDVAAVPVRQLTMRQVQLLILKDKQLRKKIEKAVGLIAQAERLAALPEQVDQEVISGLQMQADEILNAMPDVHPVDYLYESPITADALAEITGLSLEQLAGDISQDEMLALIRRAEEKNGFFLTALRRLEGRETETSQALSQHLSRQAGK